MAEKHSVYGSRIEQILLPADAVPQEWQSAGAETAMAWRIAEAVHRDQKDKAGKPYLNHPETVARQVSRPEEKAAALLHDVIEDSNLHLYDLRLFGISKETTESVKALTRRIEEPYYRYLERAADDPTAAVVKLADLDHNSDLSRYPAPGEKEESSCAYYKMRKEQLEKILRLKNRS